MATYAVINNGIVENVIVAESLEIAEQIVSFTCVEYTDQNPAGIGWTYDGKKFIAPEPTTESDTDTVK
jgi:hypothetical protein